jgi:hypothetical protein
MDITRYAIMKKLFGKGGSSVVKNQHKTFTENGIYRADSGYTGLGTVTVNVPQTGGGVNKLAQVVDKTVTEITEEDLQGATEIGMNAFYACRALKSVHIPAEVKKIGDQGFLNCSSLSTATFAEGSLLLEIGMSAFSNCPLASVTIQENVTKIGQYAFQGCSSMRSVTVKCSNPPMIQAYTFWGVHTDCVFTVPRGCGEAYKSATNWSAFSDKIVEGDV